MEKKKILKELDKLTKEIEAELDKMADIEQEIDASLCDIDDYKTQLKDEIKKERGKK